MTYKMAGIKRSKVEYFICFKVQNVLCKVYVMLCKVYVMCQKSSSEGDLGLREKVGVGMEIEIGQGHLFHIWLTRFNQSNLHSPLLY